MIPLKDQAALKQRFARDLNARVRLDFFSLKPSPIIIPGRSDCATCEDVRKLLQELAGLNLRIKLTQHDVDEEPEVTRDMGIDKVPAIVLRGPANRPLRYFGSPAGRQFAAFVETMLLVAGGKPELQPDTVKALKRLRSDAGVKLFVTTTCVHSPLMAFTLARLAMHSANVKLDVIEVAEFPDLIQRFYVRATPMTVFNDEYAVLGLMDEATLVHNLLLAAQGQTPDKGGDPQKLTPVTPPRPQQQPQQRHPTSSSGLILPR